MKTKIYVFDLGNVIVEPMNVKMLYEMLETNISYDEFLEFFNNDKSAIDAHKGLISDDEHIKKVIEFTGSKKSINEYKRIFTGPIRNELFKDCIDIIEKLKRHGNKVCLLSNLRKIDFDWFCKVYDVSKFNDLFLSYEMHLCKPDLIIYQEMIKKLNINPDQIYFFDDNKKNVEAAKQCGINAYCVTGKTIKYIFENIVQIDNRKL